MKKKKIEVYLDEWAGYDLDGTADELAKNLDDVKKRHNVESVRLDFDLVYEYGDATARIRLYGTRLETDEELKRRKIQSEASKRASIKRKQTLAKKKEEAERKKRAEHEAWAKENGYVKKAK